MWTSWSIPDIFSTYLSWAKINEPKKRNKNDIRFNLIILKNKNLSINITNLKVTTPVSNL